MSNTLYLSGFAGISGNMFLGALLDAGLPEKALRDMVGALPVSGCQLLFRKTVKAGVAATFFDVKLDHAEHHVHRHLADIVRIINAADLSGRVKERSIAVFTKLAEAEAKVHGTTVDKIHFHEVGAVDAIIDITGTVFGLDQLGIEKIYAGNLRTGCGTVQCAHGRMSVPAPATVELLHGIPYRHGDIERELITPTGAALLAVLCDGFGDRPEGFISEKTACGAGSMDLDIPNVLRAEFGRLSPLSAGELLVLETNIDDSDPRIFDYVMERLFKAGALDVWLAPIQMKKNRPAVTLSVLAPAALQAALEAVLFTETTTIGIRRYPVGRTALERREKTVETPWGPVRVKIGSLGATACSVTPEYDDCRALAAAAGVPLKDVIRTAHAAAAAASTRA